VASNDWKPKSARVVDEGSWRPKSARPVESEEDFGVSGGGDGDPLPPKLDPAFGPPVDNRMSRGEAMATSLSDVMPGVSKLAGAINAARMPGIPIKLGAAFQPDPSDTPEIAAFKKEALEKEAASTPYRNARDAVLEKSDKAIKDRPYEYGAVQVAGGALLSAAPGLGAINAVKKVGDANKLTQAAKAANTAVKFGQGSRAVAAKEAAKIGGKMGTVYGLGNTDAELGDALKDPSQLLEAGKDGVVGGASGFAVGGLGGAAPVLTGAGLTGAGIATDDPVMTVGGVTALLGGVGGKVSNAFGKRRAGHAQDADAALGQHQENVDGKSDALIARLDKAREIAAKKQQAAQQAEAELPAKRAQAIEQKAAEIESRLNKNLDAKNAPYQQELAPLSAEYDPKARFKSYQDELKALGQQMADDEAGSRYVQNVMDEVAALERSRGARISRASQGDYQAYVGIKNRIDSDPAFAQSLDKNTLDWVAKKDVEYAGWANRRAAEPDGPAVANEEYDAQVQLLLNRLVADQKAKAAGHTRNPASRVPKEQALELAKKYGLHVTDPENFNPVDIKELPLDPDLALEYREKAWDLANKHGLDPNIFSRGMLEPEMRQLVDDGKLQMDFNPLSQWDPKAPIRHSFNPNPPEAPPRREFSYEDTSPTPGPIPSEPVSGGKGLELEMGVQRTQVAAQKAQKDAQHKELRLNQLLDSATPEAARAQGQRRLDADAAIQRAATPESLSGAVLKEVKRLPGIGKFATGPSKDVLKNPQARFAHFKNLEERLAKFPDLDKYARMIPFLATKASTEQAQKLGTQLEALVLAKEEEGAQQ
jgi:hypothetical protein